MIDQTKTELKLEHLFSVSCQYEQQVVLDYTLSTQTNSVLPTQDQLQGKCKILSKQAERK